MQNNNSKFKNNINRTKEWLKENRRLIIIFFLVFLISTISFGLGYLVNREFSRAPIVIEKCSE